MQEILSVKLNSLHADIDAIAAQSYEPYESGFCFKLPHS